MKGLLNIWYLKRLKKNWCWCYETDIGTALETDFLNFLPSNSWFFFKIFVFILNAEVSAYSMKAVCLCLQNTDAFVHKTKFYGGMFAFECLLFNEILTDADRYKCFLLY